jgi:hypothetical protein
LTVVFSFVTNAAGTFNLTGQIALAVGKSDDNVNPVTYTFWYESTARPLA